EDDYYDTRSFNTNIDQEYGSRQGRFQPGGAQYSGENFTGQRRSRNDNPYGMSYVPNDDYNSGRHYDAQADYSNRDYDDLRRPGTSWTRSGQYDESFGHDVGRSRRGSESFQGHASMGD